MAARAENFARNWQDAWNAHDLPRILTHYSDDIVFRSPKAVALTGSGEVRGKAALASYWGAALAAQPDLHFAVTEVYGGHDMVVIAYVNQRGVRTVETLVMNPDGLVTFGAACHAVP